MYFPDKRLTMLAVPLTWAMAENYSQDKAGHRVKDLQLMWNSMEQ